MGCKYSTPTILPEAQEIEIYYEREESQAKELENGLCFTHMRNLCSKPAGENTRLGHTNRHIGLLCRRLTACQLDSI
jgi:hypothetical protein